jgi:RNA polymerase sigma-70 factor (ECF subfamily)
MRKNDKTTSNNRWNLSFSAVSKTLLKTTDFEAVMREQGPRIYSLAVRLCGNQAEGQDLAQETFVKAYKSWGRFRGDAEVSTWLYRICLNQWKNRVRYEKRRSFWKHFSLSASTREEDKPLEIAGADAPLDQRLQSVDRAELLQEALSRLEPEERAIVVLRDMEDKSYEAIAQELGLMLGTVKSRLARSRERLRTLLKESL